MEVIKKLIDGKVVDLYQHTLEDIPIKLWSSRKPSTLNESEEIIEVIDSREKDLYKVKLDGSPEEFWIEKSDNNSLVPQDSQETKDKDHTINNMNFWG